MPRLNKKILYDITAIINTLLNENKKLNENIGSIQSDINYSIVNGIIMNDSRYFSYLIRMLEFVKEKIKSNEDEIKLLKFKLQEQYSKTLKNIGGKYKKYSKKYKK